MSEGREIQSPSVMPGLILTVLFSIFKVKGLIDWPWFWVLAPMWLPFGFAVVLMSLIAIVAVIVTIVTGGKK